MDSITDTLDLVPIAAWYGQGKRTGTFGAYLLACYDDDGETFQSICKVWAASAPRLCVCAPGLTRVSPFALVWCRLARAFPMRP